MLSLFGFGKKCRSAKKVTIKKPPARLLKICKKYHIKTTKKVGDKRVYKSVKLLAKQCLHKALLAKKRKAKVKHTRRVRVVKSSVNSHKKEHRRRSTRS